MSEATKVEAHDALARLQDDPRAETMGPAKWLDSHRSDVEKILADKGLWLTADLLGIVGTTMHSRANRRGITGVQGLKPRTKKQTRVKDEILERGRGRPAYSVYGTEFVARYRGMEPRPHRNKRSPDNVGAVFAPQRNLFQNI